MTINPSQTQPTLSRVNFWIKSRFGSKKGLLNTVWYSLLLKLGGFKACRNIELATIKRLIFICQGNICRSPLGEICAKQSGFITESFGLDCSNFHSADPRAIAFAKNLGLDLNSHKTRHIRLYEPQPGDLLIGMEPKHLKALQQLFGGKIPITLAGLWLNKPTAYIHDPYNTHLSYFLRCENHVVLAAKSISAGRKPITNKPQM